MTSHPVDLTGQPAGFPSCAGHRQTKLNTAIDTKKATRKPRLSLLTLFLFYLCLQIEEWVFDQRVDGMTSVKLFFVSCVGGKYI